MKDNNYKIIDGYEVHPVDIAYIISRFMPGSINGLDEDEKDLQAAIYQLDALCQNEYNPDFYRVLYKYLAYLTEQKINEYYIPFK